jgi:hypothetical protein
MAPGKAPPSIKQVLARDVACLCRAQERASGTELVRRAEASRRHHGHAIAFRLLDRDAFVLGIGGNIRRQSFDVEGSGLTSSAA